MQNLRDFLLVKKNGIVVRPKKGKDWHYVDSRRKKDGIAYINAKRSEAVKLILPEIKEDFPNIANCSHFCIIYFPNRHERNSDVLRKLDSLSTETQVLEADLSADEQGEEMNPIYDRLNQIEEERSALESINYGRELYACAVPNLGGDYLLLGHFGTVGHSKIDQLHTYDVQAELAKFSDKLLEECLF
jgi:hypothetical protein